LSNRTGEEPTWQQTGAGSTQKAYTPRSRTQAAFLWLCVVADQWARRIAANIAKLPELLNRS
jgi:hypothetical protein